MNDKNRTLILEGPLSKSILLLALPLMLNNLIGTLYNLGDAFWVSKIGDTEVAAVNFVWPVSFLTISFAGGIAMAGAAIISQYIGANKIKDAQETADQLYFFGIIFGIISGIVGIIATPYVIGLMGATGGLYTASVAYLRILFIEIPFLFLMNIYTSINQAQGDTLRPTLLNASSAVLNILLDPLFIFTFNLGIEGAAIATVLSRVPFALFGVYQLSKGCNYIKITPFKFNIIRSKMRDLLRIGIPSSIGSCGVAFGFVIMHVFVVKYGELAVAAMGIGNRINSLAFMPAIGVGAALTTITGQNLGAGNPERVKKAFKLSLLLSTGFLILTSSLNGFFSRELIGIFTQSDEVLEMGSFYLKSLAITTWTISFFNCTLGLLNGSGHTIHSMILDAGRLWLIRIPLIIFLGSFATLGEKAIWYGISSSNVISAILAIIFALSGVWKKPKIKNLSIR